MRDLLNPGTGDVQHCADCLLRIHGQDARLGPDDKPYHPGCFERLFPVMKKYQDGQGSLTFTDREHGQ